MNARGTTSIFLIAQVYHLGEHVLLQRLQRAQAAAQRLHSVAGLIQAARSLLAGFAQFADFVGAALHTRHGRRVFLAAGFDPALERVDFPDLGGRVELLELLAQP